MRRDIRGIAVVLAVALAALGLIAGPAQADAPSSPKITAGNDHTCALTPIGFADCWGDNTYSQATDQAGPYTQITAGIGHTCALTPDGAADCWGAVGAATDFGQATDQPGPYTQIAAGGFHTCALTPDGAADCWGWNFDGQATDQAGPYTQITAGRDYTCALTPDGAADCWGFNGLGGATDQAGPFTQITAGSSHTCALNLGRAADCWGWNFFGQATDQPGPFTQITAGGYHTCALTPAGDAACWGENAEGQAPPAGVTGPFTQIAAGNRHTCALTPAGNATCWGNNANGQATDQAGPYESAATAPDTTIDISPSDPSGSSVVFGYSATEAGSTFECDMDGGGFASCGAGGKTYSGLSDGSHTFSVRATDVAANTDPTPASYTWTVDATVPTTTIDSGPSGTVSATAADFSFSADESPVTFRCSVDGGAYSACTSPLNIPGPLANGAHTFAVKAKDAAGNTDDAAIRTWTVDTNPGCPIFASSFELVPLFDWSDISPRTCQGSCGGQSSAGCYCDASCLGFSDCCVDACLTCGYCP